MRDEESLDLRFAAGWSRDSSTAFLVGVWQIQISEDVFYEGYKNVYGLCDAGL